MRNLTLTLLAAILVLGGFYGGFKVGQGRADASAAASPTPGVNLGAAAGLRGGGGAAGAGAAAGAGGAGAAGAGTGAGQGSAAGGGLGRGGNAVQGSITAVGNGTITVHDRASNADVTVNVGAATINKTESGQVSDLQKNVTVAVQGQKGADGSVQATAVTIVPGPPG